MSGWQRSIDNTDIGQRQAKKGAFTELKASTDPVDEHGVGDRGFNDGRYTPKDLDATTATDPATNAAVTIDAYGGVIITLTGAGNAQTLQDPTDTVAIKRFIVVVKGAFNIEVNGITMSGGEAQRFIWDGASWIAITAVDADDIAATPYGEVIATDVQAYLDALEDGRAFNTDVNNSADSPMVVTGGAITTGTNAGTFKVEVLTCLLRATDSSTGALTSMALAEQDNQPITLADTTYFVCLNYNDGVTPTISLLETNPYEADKRNIPIGKVMKDTSNNVHYISGEASCKGENIAKFGVKWRLCNSLFGYKQLHYGNWNSFWRVEQISFIRL